MAKHLGKLPRCLGHSAPFRQEPRGRLLGYQIAVLEPLPSHILRDTGHLVNGVAAAIVVAPGELSDVAAQVLLAHVVVGAVVATLQ